MMNFELFRKGKNREGVTIIQIKNGRLENIHEVVFLPLFKKHSIETLTYPTRQQMHSKRYYIMKNKTHLTTCKHVNLKHAIEVAKKIILKDCTYANNT